MGGVEEAMKGGSEVAVCLFGGRKVGLGVVWMLVNVWC